MTPTLIGRWQTRILLFAIVGSLVSLPFFLITGNDPIFFIILLYIAGFGLVWDVLYNYLQQFRWDHDWPAALQVLAALWEGIFFAIVYKLVPLPGVERQAPLWLFALHYGLAWLAIFIASQSIMRVIFPRWRFHGGQWL
ncbi:hypothetical protein [Thermocoleostomius sinensis]|jgi:hypothetical protein|uniref:Uncharacterized protein n=1 Tax=Thermocoleostomius sinensis A174 TaxID=2016057 RepID=A0A9E8ZF54_9CYAN|nr:hypothetical protein [Thermocoleostomius sinensis]WAL62230.1 hypothetical protein OXH18_09645 [Thermocoleostomius sinensis A174]